MSNRAGEKPEGGGGDTNLGDQASCPVEAPALGAACGKEDLFCSYGLCVGGSFRCSDHKWVYVPEGCNPPIPIPCPAEQPADGSSCNADGFAYYPDSCSYEVAGCGPATALCQKSDYTWRVSGCVDGGGAAGASSTGDAGAAGAPAHGGEGGNGGDGAGVGGASDAAGAGGGAED